MRITVLAGGLSPERDVSMTTGSLVAAALTGRGYAVCLCDLYTGLSPDGKTPVFSLDPPPAYRVDRRMPDLEALKRQTDRGERRIGPGVVELCREADIVFLALHGDVGENGQLQALLDMEGIRYTGSGYEGSLLAMDKDLSKQMLSRAGIPTPLWVTVPCCADSIPQIENEIGYPSVIKPLSCGSSVGVSMVHDRAELERALNGAAAFGTRVLAERMISGRELTVSVLGDRVLPPVEIIPLKGFYDYENKYQSGATREVCPAELTQEQMTVLNDAAKKGFEVLHLAGYARFDVIMDTDGTPWVLEANTLPGMTPTSLLPQEAAAVGMDYGTLCEEIIHLSLEKDR